LHADQFLREAAEIAERINRDDVERLARALHSVRENKGRVFVVGLGGSYANAEHAAADLRKLCEIEAYAPNVAEMSAWINDSGPEHAFSGHLRWIGAKDALLVLSVGGGESDVSPSLMAAVSSAALAGIPVYGIVGPKGGYTAQKAVIAVRIPAPENRITPHTEAFQAVIWHLLVSHPMLQRKATKW
jgi:D-sedoheptulose 7-phosphate isomerase